MEKRAFWGIHGVLPPDRNELRSAALRRRGNSLEGGPRRWHVGLAEPPRDARRRQRHRIARMGRYLPARVRPDRVARDGWERRRLRRPKGAPRADARKPA